MVIRSNGYIDRHGITQGHVKQSFTKAYAEDDEYGMMNKKEKDKLDCLIISSESKVTEAWEFIDTLMCFISCYTYMQYACFAHEDDTMEVIFESFFLVSIFQTFLTDYTIEGEREPVRDLMKIVQRYLKNGLMFDLIP